MSLIVQLPPLIGDLITLKDGTKCSLSGFPERRRNRRQLGWRVKYWHNGIEITRAIELDDIAVNNSRPRVEIREEEAI